jgi:small subunit ribosomal protein S20
LSSLIDQHFTVKAVKNNKLTPIFKGYIPIEIMPNTKSAIRRVRRVEKQTAVNRLRKSKYRSAIKKMEDLIKSKETEKVKKFFPNFQSILMQVAKTGVINKKTASRKISKISKRLSK